MKIGLFEASCADCGNLFGKPELGEFAYGQFLFTGERGSVYAYFEGIDHPVWVRLEASAPLLRDRTEQGRAVQAACAYFADPVAEQRLQNQHVCPNCLSHNLATWGGRKRGEAEIPVASFSRFLSLSEEGQLHEMEAFYSAFMAQQIAPRDVRNARA
jgi:hypothetical protein